MVQRVKTPKGIIGFPDDMTPEEIQKVLDAEFNVERGPWWRDHLDIPAGLAGGLGGAAFGAKIGAATLNPIAAIIGGVVGGMAGTFAGEVAEDVIDDKDVEWGNAFKEAAISGGIDAALLGTGKFVGKPFLNYVRSMRAKDVGPEEAARRYLETARVGEGKAGSQESIAASQNILQKYGATLTPFQATGRHGLMQRIADIGLLSQRAGRKNYQLVNDAVSAELEKITGRFGVQNISANDLGADIYTIIDEGRKASFQTYEQGMDQLRKVISGQGVETSKLYRAVEDWLVAGRRKATDDSGAAAAFSTYQDDSVKFAEEMLEQLSMMKKMPANVLIDYEKKIMSDMGTFSDFNSTKFNSVAARELSELSTAIRNSTTSILQKVNPDAARDYASIKTAYAETIQGIIPENIEGLVKGGKIGMYERLGRLVSMSGSEAQLKSMMNSIKVAHRELQKAGKDPEPLDDLMNAMKSGFLTQYIPRLVSGGFDIGKYSGLSAQFSKPKEAARLKIILGDDAPKVRQLFNLMDEATADPLSNMGELSVRSAEISAGSSIAQGGAALAAENLLTSGAILMAPVFFAKFAYNPKRVNQLIAFQNKKFNNNDAMFTAAGNLAVDIYNELNDDEQRELMSDLGFPGEKPVFN
jgi:hypothetical protein